MLTSWKEQTTKLLRDHSVAQKVEVISMPRQRAERKGGAR